MCIRDRDNVALLVLSDERFDKDIRTFRLVVTLLVGKVAVVFYILQRKCPVARTYFKITASVFPLILSKTMSSQRETHTSSSVLSSKYIWSLASFSCCVQLFLRQGRIQ
eukprot:TRINITY_DN16430_c0_g1_i1.p2 TRINITY_DN16430_c0_g1~~TRINITY_DN16430_c0_g1_i1.p2  ORF type:complete len:128 (+),score=17.04 TRINITY_DN16430_c0_g1_i1:60-386(+)